VSLLNLGVIDYLGLSQRRAVTKLQNLWFDPFAMYISVCIFIL